MPGRIATPMSAEPKGPARPGLYRLLAWASPAFPTGAFSYSHGLEAAAAAGTVRDRATLEGWIAAIVRAGCGRIDGDILCHAHRAARAGDPAALDAVNRRGVAFRASAELALETSGQGAAFLATCRAAWPEPFLEAWAARLAPAEPVCHAAIFGAATACAGIALADALLGHLEAFAANLMAAGLRLGIIGQTDGQRILAALAPAIEGAAAAAATRDPADFGSATWAVDLAAIAHETQYTRLFRS